MTKKVDYLIVGQGLAGTLAAHFAQKAGKKVMVFGEPEAHPCSQTAAGIMNPITGRYYVKSWLIDDLLPFAKATYGELEAFLGGSLFYPQPILRALFSYEDENSWLAKSARTGYESYMQAGREVGDYAAMVAAPLGYGEVLQGGRLDIAALIERFRARLTAQGLYAEGHFRHEALALQPDGVRYEGIEAQKVIFCEGHRVAQNPFFGHLPLVPSKGEVLVVRIPHFAPSKILKHQLFVVPLGGERYWVGSNYMHQFADSRPTPAVGEQLVAKLRSVLRVPFEVEAHLSGIRPTVKNRRPLVGQHPQHPQLAILNGLGTKGATLAPYFARQLVENLTIGTPIHPNADVAQWFF